MPAEEQVVRAVEILRGTTFDFRVEATADVVALYGLDVLVAALERLDAGIEPGPAQNRPLEQSDAPLPQGREAAQPVATVEEAEQQLKAIEEEPPTALDEEHRTLPGPDQGTRLALQDVQATLGEFLALALPYVEESDMQQLADVVFSRFDAIIAAARPAQKGERVLSTAETRQCVGKTMLNGLLARGFAPPTPNCMKLAARGSTSRRLDASGPAPIAVIAVGESSARELLLYEPTPVTSLLGAGRDSQSPPVSS